MLPVTKVAKELGANLFACYWLLLTVVPLGTYHAKTSYHHHPFPFHRALKKLVVVAVDNAELKSSSVLQRYLLPYLHQHYAILERNKVRTAIRFLRTTPIALKSPIMAKKLLKLTQAQGLLVVEHTKVKGDPALKLTFVGIHAGKSAPPMLIAIPKNRPSRIGVQNFHKTMAYLLPASGHHPDTVTVDHAADQPLASKHRDHHPTPPPALLDGQDPTESKASNANEASDTFMPWNFDQPSATAAKKPAHTSTTLTTAEGMSDTKPMGVELLIGGLFLQRTATIGAKVVPAQVTSLPCYCGTSNNSNPFLPSFALSMSLYPGALISKSPHAYRQPSSNLGLRMEGYLSATQSTVATTSSTSNANTVKSLLGGATAALVYRAYLGEGRKAVALLPEFGIGVYGFSMSGGPFPSTLDLSPELGLAVFAPLGTEVVALIARVNYWFAMGNSNTARALLGNPLLGQGVQTGGGFNLRFAKLWQLRLEALYGYYQNSYTGAANFVDTSGNALGVKDASIYDKNIMLQALIGFNL